MTPGTYEFKIVKGTTDPFIVLLRQGNAPMPATSAILTIATKKANAAEGDIILRKSSADANVELDEVTIAEVDYTRFTWTPTPAESRELPGKGYFELEIRNSGDGSQLVPLVGTVLTSGGINTDD